MKSSVDQKEYVYKLAERWQPCLFTSANWIMGLATLTRKHTQRGLHNSDTWTKIPRFTVKNSTGEESESKFSKNETDAGCYFAPDIVSDNNRIFRRSKHPVGFSYHFFGKAVKRLRSALKRDGRSGNQKQTYFFFRPYLNKAQTNTCLI